MLLQEWLVPGNPFLTNVGRVADDHVETAVCQRRGEALPPGVEWGRLGNDAVALLDVVIEAGQHLADLSGLDPQAEPANFDRLGVQVHAEKVVLQDLLVHVGKESLVEQVGQAVVGSLIVDVQLVEGFEQERAEPHAGSTMRIVAIVSSQAFQKPAKALRPGAVRLRRS